MNCPRYLRNLAAWYRLLTRTHGYAKEDVRLCWADGDRRDLDGDAELETLLPARRDQVEAALAWLAETGSGDKAFLLVSNHGDEAGFPFWGGELFSPRELAAALGDCQATKVLIFGQCFAGAFEDLGISSAVACGACEVSAPSWAVPVKDPRSAPSFDEFLYQLAGAFGGVYPDGRKLRAKLPAPSEVTVAEAFSFAKRRDRQPETPWLDDPRGIAATTTL